MEECIDSLNDATVSSTLEASFEYWKIKIEELDQDRTAFTSNNSLYRFLTLPFGVKNAPETFQREIGAVFDSM